MRSAWLAVVVAFVTACGPRVVDPACVTYIACQAAFDDAAGLDPVDTSVYAEDGDCWAGDPTAAGRCVALQAELAGRKVIMVLLDSAGRYSRIGDAERLRKWFSEVQVLKTLGFEAR